MGPDDENWLVTNTDDPGEPTYHAACAGIGILTENPEISDPADATTNETYIRNQISNHIERIFRDSQTDSPTWSGMFEVPPIRIDGTIDHSLTNHGHIVASSADTDGDTIRSYISRNAYDGVFTPLLNESNPQLIIEPRLLYASLHMWPVYDQTGRVVAIYRTEGQQVDAQREIDRQTPKPVTASATGSDVENRPASVFQTLFKKRPRKIV